MNATQIRRRESTAWWTVVSLAVMVALVVGFVVPANADPAYVPAGAVIAAPGPGLPIPREVPGKEFSSHSDRNHFHVGDPEQVLNWDGVGGTYNGVDYSGSRTPPYPDSEEQVDALANITDALYFQVAIYDTAHLVFSVESVGGAGPDFDQGSNIYYERRITGAGGLWADQQVSQPDGAPGSDIDVNPTGGLGILDLDGLELWGPEPPLLDDADPPFIGDANRYSLGAGIGADPFGVSVWDIAGGLPAAPLWFASEVATMVSMASGIPIGPDLNEDTINLDGLMTYGEENIMFSIDPVADALGMTLLDGGEIFVGTRVGGPGGPLAAGFLFHGGHLWDTAFDVMGTFDLLSENVDALEAVSTIPEPASVVLAALALLNLAGVRRRGCRTR